MQLPYSTHFDIKVLAEGVYAAIARENTGAASNAGFVDLGQRTLVFDTFLTPPAAAELLAAAIQLTGRPPAYVINSHYHGDHVRGNQVFGPEAIIIATHRTHELMATVGTEQLAWLKANGPAMYEDKKKQLAAEQDERKRREIEAELAYFRPLIESLPAVSLRLPQQTFEGRLVFRGSRRTAELITYGGGHTESDAILYLPDDRLAFLGDLLFVGSHPLLRQGDPDEWLRILGEIAQLDAGTFVGGHGPLGTIEDVRLIERYIPALQALAAEVVAAGGSSDDAAAQPIPEPFAHLRDVMFTFSSNMRFLHQRARQA